ncbi:hypothetical protein BKA67DRAFT_563267, partial [Truncatella angustata]
MGRSRASPLCTRCEQTKHLSGCDQQILKSLYERRRRAGSHCSCNNCMLPTGPEIASMPSGTGVVSQSCHHLNCKGQNGLCRRCGDEAHRGMTCAEAGTHRVVHMLVIGRGGELNVCPECLTVYWRDGGCCDMVCTTYPDVCGRHWTWVGSVKAIKKLGIGMRRGPNGNMGNMYVIELCGHRA